MRLPVDNNGNPRRDRLTGPTMPEAPVKPDLGALRIDAHKRGARKAGRRITIILFVLLAALVVVGGVYAYMHHAPSVQVATVDAPGTAPQALLNARVGMSHRSGAP